MRTFTAMWTKSVEPLRRRGRHPATFSLRRAGNSLAHEQQPENNVQRIVLEMLGVTLSADARARALQLPA